MDPVIGIVINVNGNIDLLKFSNIKGYQETVGGYFECVGFGPNHRALVNDSGWSDGLPANPLATLLWKHYCGDKRAWSVDDQLYGPVIIVGKINPVTLEDDGGDYAPSAEVWFMAQMLNAVRREPTDLHF